MKLEFENKEQRMEQTDNEMETLYWGVVSPRELLDRALDTFFSLKDDDLVVVGDGHKPSKQFDVPVPDDVLYQLTGVFTSPMYPSDVYGEVLCLYLRCKSNRHRVRLRKKRAPPQHHYYLCLRGELEFRYDDDEGRFLLCGTDLYSVEELHRLPQPRTVSLETFMS
ncbi:hypothetical protein N9V47_04050 [Luminiphilus sp.]|nr:hypothetical protein [Luminiphilus sp.]